MKSDRKKVIKWLAKEYIMILKILLVAIVVGLIFDLVRYFNGDMCYYVGLSPSFNPCKVDLSIKVATRFFLISYGSVWLFRGGKFFVKSIRWADKTSKT